MSFGSAAQSSSRAAEFARLFDLFERVATRRTRATTGDASEVISADDIAHVPAEFAPLLKNVSTILSLRALCDEELARRTQQIQGPSTPTLRNPSLSGSPLLSLVPTAAKAPEKGVGPVDPDSPTFPVGGGYPFTFKLMLHKLYELDEWAEKVKNALETSKSQFKPLAERDQNVVKNAVGGAKERGEKRSSIRSVLSVSSKPPTKTRRSNSLAIPVALSKSETSRALKKRCIGRRKSVSGPMSSGVWVYDAAVSAVEMTDSRHGAEIPFSKPRNQVGRAETRARHRSLTVLEGRRVNVSIPLLHSGPTAQQQDSFQFSLPILGASETERLSEPYKRAAIKRPLCI